jgi:hypothetical protein
MFIPRRPREEYDSYEKEVLKDGFGRVRFGIRSRILFRPVRMCMGLPQMWSFVVGCFACRLEETKTRTDKK